jgi:superfamily I DNA/RNA helicase
MDSLAYLSDLNVAQRAAVEHGVSAEGAQIMGPLLIIAGTGTRSSISTTAELATS